MKRHSLLAIAGLSMLLLSCEKELEDGVLNMPDHEPVTIIEGNVDLLIDNGTVDRDGPFQVTIRNSKPFLGTNNTFEGVTGALVIISDNTGQTDTLTEQSAGVYVTNTLEAYEGRIYTMSATVGEESYTASSFLSPITMLDTLLYDFEEGVPPIEEGYYVNTLFTLNPQASPYFRIIARRNGQVYFGDPESQFRYLLIDDSFGLSGSLNFELPYNYDLGDTASMDLLTLDPFTYLYYNSIDQQMQAGLSPLSPVPGDIQGNLSGEGVSGHFAARSINRQSVVIQ